MAARGRGVFARDREPHSILTSELRKDFNRESGDDFEIIVADGPSDRLDSLVVRFPQLPLRILEARDSDPAAGIGRAAYDLILLVSP